MTPEELLKRIEEEHHVEGSHGEGCFNEYGIPHDPCDVVKLARALCALIECAHGGCTVCMGLAERTLREVAGEEAPDKELTNG